jgi:hypothetical protein
VGGGKEGELEVDGRKQWGYEVNLGYFRNLGEEDALLLVSFPAATAQLLVDYNITAKVTLL